MVDTFLDTLPQEVALSLEFPTLPRIVSHFDHGCQGLALKS